MKKNWIRLLKVILLAIGSVAVFVLATKRADGPNTIKDQALTGGTNYDFAMGTSVSATVYGGDPSAGRRAIDCIKRADTELLSWREQGSELARLNADYKEKEPYPVSAELYDAVSLALSVCEASEGALDITIRPLADAWGVEDATQENFRVPTEDEIQEAQWYVRYESVHADHDIASDGRDTVTLDREGMILDLGACGKGYALDLAYREIGKSVTGGTVTCGGSVLIFGEKTDGSDFHVGIRDPKGGQDDMLGTLTFGSALPKDAPLYISTSGDYEKYIEKDGVRYHHILDRRTGAPAENGLSSVTVVSKNGLVSDALSTACFVLGYEKSLPLLKTYDSEAVFIDHDNQVTVTEGLKENYSSN